METNYSTYSQDVLLTAGREYQKYFKQNTNRVRRITPARRKRLNRVFMMYFKTYGVVRRNLVPAILPPFEGV